MAVTIPFVTQFNGKGIQRAIKEFKSLNSNIDRARFLTRRLLIPATVALTGVTAVLGKQLFDAARAAAADETAQKLLAAALEKSTGATDDQIKRTDRMVDQLQRATGVADDELRPALANLARATGNLTEAQSLLQLALDVSAGSGLSLESVQQILINAMLGNYKGLKQLGIEFESTGDKTKDFQTITQRLADLFGGAAKTRAEGFEGMLQRLRIAYDEIVERIGYAVLPYLQRFADFVLKAVVPAVEQFITSLQAKRGLRGAFEDGIAAAGPFGAALVRVFGQVTDAALTFVYNLIVAYETFAAIQTAIKGLAGGLKTAAFDFAKVLGAAAAAYQVRQLRDESNAYFASLAANMPTLEAFHRTAAGTPEPLGRTADQLERIAQRTKDATPDLTGLGTGLDKVAQAAGKAADALRDRMAQALDDAKDRLRDAQDAFNDFKDEIKTAITGVIDFGDAAQTSAERGGVTFFDALQEQADKAKEFGSLVDQLLAAGLSHEALQQVIDAGQEAGSFIARELLKSSENILRANKLVEETTAIADAIAANAANKFYAAGVANGEAYVKGIEEAIKAAEKRLAAKGLRPADVKGIGASFDATVAGLAQPIAGTSMAPAVIPSPTSVTVNTVTAPANLGDVIVDALRDYNRRSGPLQLQIE
jgi:ABC-type transporter Mla subunit MlaD